MPEDKKLADKPFRKRGPQNVKHQVAAGSGGAALVGYINYLLLSNGTIDQTHAAFLGPFLMAVAGWGGTLVRNVTTEIGWGKFLPAILAALLLTSPLSPVACAMVQVEGAGGDIVHARVFGAGQVTTCPTVVPDSPGVPNLMEECVTITGGTMSDNAAKTVGGLFSAILSPVLGIITGGLSGLSGAGSSQ